MHVPPGHSLPEAREVCTRMGLQQGIRNRPKQRVQPSKGHPKFEVLHAMANEILRQMKRPEGIQDPRGFILIIDLNGWPG